MEVLLRLSQKETNTRRPENAGSQNSETKLVQDRTFSINTVETS